MELTIDPNGGKTETFRECFDYLETTLSDHYLLTEDERWECAEAVRRLKRVFKRFYERKQQT